MTYSTIKAILWPDTQSGDRHSVVAKRPSESATMNSVCNRYRLTYAKPYLAERFGAVGEIEERARYNIAPTQQVVTVRKEEGKKTRKFTTIALGLIPSWAKDMSIGTQTLNARSETVTTKPAFRGSDPEEALPHPRRWILRMRKMGSVKPAVLL